MKSQFVMIVGAPVQIPVHQERIALVEKLNSLEQERWKYLDIRGELKQKLRQVEVELEQIDLMKQDIANQLGY